MGLALEQKRTKETKNSNTEEILLRELLVLKLGAILIRWSRGPERKRTIQQPR